MGDFIRSIGLRYALEFVPSSTCNLTPWCRPIKKVGRLLPQRIQSVRAGQTLHYTADLMLSASTSASVLSKTSFASSGSTHLSIRTTPTGSLTYEKVSQHESESQEVRNGVNTDTDSASVAPHSPFSLHWQELVSTCGEVWSSVNTACCVSKSVNVESVHDWTSA